MEEDQTIDQAMELRNAKSDAAAYLDQLTAARAREKALLAEVERLTQQNRDSQDRVKHYRQKADAMAAQLKEVIEHHEEEDT